MYREELDLMLQDAMRKEQEIKFYVYRDGENVELELDYCTSHGVVMFVEK